MSSIALMQPRPPFIVFEQRAIEDRNASIAAGGLVMKDVDYVVIRQVGSRDTVEKEAAEWLNDIDRMVRANAYPADWAKHHRQAYEAFKEGREAPELGLSVREWPSVSKAQAENLIRVGVRTVEDVAVMNEQSMQRFGMGARELKAKAAAYLETRENNKAAEQLAALQVEIENKDTRIATLEEQNALLARRLDALEAAQADPKPRKRA